MPNDAQPSYRESVIWCWCVSIRSKSLNTYLMRCRQPIARKNPLFTDVSKGFCLLCFVFLGSDACMVFNKKEYIYRNYTLLSNLLIHATKESITGTSTSTPTTVASAAPECNPNREIATATASSKKLDVPIRQAGPAML